jgi:hypothetical protein
LKSLVQLNLALVTTKTSPSWVAVPMPPAVPVEMTSFGRASPTICCHSATIGAESPSVARCSSDFTARTSISPIVTWATYPMQPASRAGEWSVSWGS